MKGLFEQLNRSKKRFMDLQLFADGDGNGAESQDDGSTNDDGETGKKYTDDEVDKIIAKKFAEWEKKQQKATQEAQEAQKLANMTAQEKRDHELQELQQKIARYEKQEAVGAMTRVARTMLADEEINVSDELVANLVAEDAESTKANVEAFAKAFKEAVQKEVASKISHSTPSRGKPNKLTREDIMKVTNRRERQKLINENLDLFR